MNRRWITTLVALTALSLAACGDGDADPAQPSGPASTGRTADTSSSIGRIVFNRGEGGTEHIFTYTINPDGSAEQQLFEGRSENPRWSPDGTEVHIFCCSDGMVAHFIDLNTGELRALEPPDPAVELFCGGAWTPDGERVACEGYGVEDPSRNGVYWVRSSDGGGLEQITSNPDGEDIPNGDFSPDGDRLVFVRVGENGQAGIFVVDVEGSGLRRISGRDQLVDDIFGGSWSPDGNQILFVSRESPDHHKEIWVVNADGSSRHQLRIEGTCGGPLSDPGSFGCYSPSWSPDGTKIVFVRSTPDPSAPQGFHENVYIVNADGTALLQVTNGGLDDNPDWGIPQPTG